MGAPLQVAIVGGSLAGLATAHALLGIGCRVRVFERAAAGFETRGGGLGIDVALSFQVNSSSMPPHLVLSRRRVWSHGQAVEQAARECVTSYGALWRWFHASLPPATVVFGQPVNDVIDTGQGVELALADGSRHECDLVVCADGGQGSSFRWLPRGAARYAGYVLWRGLCAAHDLDDREALDDALSIAAAASRHFVAYPVPAYDGATAPSAQMLNWGCYLPTSEADAQALREAGGRSLVPHALERGAPAAWLAHLARAVADLPPWVATLTAATARHGMVAPHPVFELDVQRLHGRRIVLVGDCAHLASPITGAGARTAFVDALTLADSLHDASDLDTALTAYGARRAPEALQLVARGRTFGAALVADQS